MKTLADFTQLVKLCIQVAEAEFGKLPDIDIRYDLRGRAAGMAGHTGYRYYMRFNREAMQLDWEHMVKETIPHEIAHIVAYAKPELGAKNHNWGWKMIARRLGCTGDRCHTMKLTPAKVRSRFIYVTDRGDEVIVGPKHHAGLQNGKYDFLRSRRTGERISKQHFKQAA